MELKIIDEQPFIVTRSGKHEAIHTLTDITKSAHQSIHEANQVIIDLRSAEQEMQKRIESAVLNFDDASQHRTDLNDIRANIEGNTRDIEAVQARIVEARNLIDRHVAETIRRADKDRLNALLIPFNDTLKEHQL